VRLDRAIADVVAGGDPATFVELGRASARHRTELLGEHVALVSPHAFLSRLAEEHRRFHTFGRAEYRRLGFRRGQIAFSEYPEVDPAYCLTGTGYLQGAVEMLSGGPAQVRELTCQCRGEAACLYDLRWEGAPAPR
jgi:predicted hydrocarbon binding protein